MAEPRSVVTIDASEPLEKINSIIARDGGVIVSNFLSPELTQECLTAVEPYLENRPLYTSTATHEELGKEFFSPGSQRVYGLLGKMPEQMTKILRLPVWNGIMERFLSDEFSSYTGEALIPQKSGYMLNATTAIRLVPGAKAQPLHRDQMAYQIRHDPRNPLFTVMVGCLIAASKTTIKNGATRVIPGSHLWGDDRAPKLEEAVYAEMEPGSALFTLGSTFHAGSENKCDSSDPEALRTLFAVFGQRDYFRQHQEEVLSTPVEVARKLPDDILKITGYYKSVGGVGYVEDHQAPVEFLHQARNLNGIGKLGSRSVVVGI
ncbi:hypothetical protein, variant [Exophiala xenobiotica]|uniref:Phytanoyl-CoA dioxygenase n=1 Tax=Exophiala xenobiotica TaxID=348802 RepID=A0A0D2D9V3_9EURO|nr:hypothetical protein, variant [Exophiala xenobiotica]XP_013319622.1 uncharacterized protein PV05_03521 [Exophiala xenobiotica]KIW59037.1 hypothetical protein PV05_03521 [Exophiala xenobiotica]KIW59038.1 hypothetical protein, variant [Exophiala xenobiotica]